MLKNNVSIHKKIAALVASLALIGSAVAAIPYFATSNSIPGGGA